MLSTLILLVGFFLCAYHFWKKPSHKLPPGPKPLPSSGNITDMPPAGTPEYQHWLKSKDSYGPISHMAILGQSLIIIHDSHATHDLLKKSSAKTSRRPQMYFGSKLCGYEVFLALHQNSSTFRQHRKLIHQQLGRYKNISGTVPKYSRS